MRNKRFNVVANVLILSMLAVLFYVTTYYGTVITASSNVEKPLYRGEGKEKVVSLMINVYWGTEYIEDMLAVFDKYGYKTTFFIGGSWAEKNYELVNKIVEKGHELGNHGYLHKDHSKLSYNVNYDEINMTNKLLKNFTGKDVKLFAPPSGAFCNDTLKAAKNLGMTTIMWSKDTIDWRDKDKNVTFTRATKNLTCGDLILAHPTKHTLEALDGILGYYKANGFRCVTVSENVGVENNI